MVVPTLRAKSIPDILITLISASPQHEPRLEDPARRGLASHTRAGLTVKKGCVLVIGTRAQHGKEELPEEDGNERF